MRSLFIRLAGGLAVIATATPAFAQSQSAEPPPPARTDDPLLINVTANRSPTAIQRTGSAITVISGEELRKTSPSTVVDALRQVPGVAISSSGGAAQVSTVFIRGGASRNTLVLVDGVRVNDPSSTENEFDFSTLVPTDIERLEVLRGPQSALYGSDAMGGVINIVTRKGRGEPRASLSLEGGSYATRAFTAAVSGGTPTLSYALSLTGAQAAGYSAIGYRIGRFQARAPLGFENDGWARLGGAARFSWRPTPGSELEFALTRSRNRVQFDQSFGYFDVPAKSESDLTTGHVRGSFDSFDGLLRTQVTLFANQTERVSKSVADFGFGLSRTDFGYTGTRTGAEVQNTLNLKEYGSFILGGAIERERYVGRSLPVIDPFGSLPARNTADRSTRSAFALYQVTLAGRLDLSFSGRLDDVEKVDTFYTGRVTAAYRIPESGTKLRASFGTGAKAPALDQLYNPSYGTPTLQPEKSVGGDIGIDQQFLDGKLQFSVTAFANRYRNLFVFSSFDPVTFQAIGCPAAQANNGCYFNQGRARTYGVENEVRVQLWPGFAQLTASYTYLDARDSQTGFKLARRPMNQGRLQLTLTPIEGLTIEPSVTLVGQRFSGVNQSLRLQPYAKFDIRAAYKLNANLEVYARAENLTNARYQEVYNYGTPGRSIYGGVRATW
jgi:vitamin B12 transporter